MDSADQWRWTDDEGVQRLLGADELRSALADGRLKATTLVWKRGMPSWVPAGEVPELRDAIADGPDTVTAQRPILAGALGRKAPPTPSIPAPGIFPVGGPKPSNMIDIAALRAAQGRPAVNTLMGVGSQRGKDQGARAEVSIPAAPKLPRIGSKPDGAWKDGAARGDDEEETVTQLRDDEDAATVQDHKVALRSAPPDKKRQPTKPPLKDPPDTRAPSTQQRSVPPPRKKRPRNTVRAGTRTDVLSEAKKPPARRTLPPVKGGLPKTMVSPGDAKRPRPKSIPPPVGSSEVLSEAFKSSRGLGKLIPTPTPADTMLSANEEQQQRLVAAAAKASEDALSTLQAPTKPRGAARPIPTGPLPEMRPEQPSTRQNPPFANEAWVRSDGPERSAPPQPEPPPKTEQVPSGPTEPLPQDMLGLAPMMPPPPAEPPKQRDIPTHIPPKPLGMAGITLKLPVAAGAGVAVLTLLVVSFMVGRVSSPAKAEMASVIEARTGWVSVPLFARASLPSAPPRPCLMLRAPAQVAPTATRTIPIELSPAGERLAVGYAESSTLPRGLMFDPATGAAEITHSPEAAGDSEIERVMPLAADDEVSFLETLVDESGVTGAVYVRGKTPFIVGFSGGKTVKLSERGGEAVELWPLEEAKGSPDALTARAGPTGIAVAYRHNNRIYYGALDAEQSVAHPASVVAGSGGIVGKPSVATNGREVSVVFADKPAAPDAPIELRWAHGPFGKPLLDAPIMELPEGGPGGDAQAPAIAALPGDRWVVMWTEGKARGPKTLRAQTYDRKYRRIGDALRVSPATGSFGQGTIGVVGNEAVVMFLQATGTGYEMWGTVMQCR